MLTLKEEEPEQLVFLHTYEMYKMTQLISQMKVLKVLIP